MKKMLILLAFVLTGCVQYEGFTSEAYGVAVKLCESHDGIKAIWLRSVIAINDKIICNDGAYFNTVLHETWKVKK